MKVKRKCKLCDDYLFGTIEYFIQHGEDHHPEYVLTGIPRNGDINQFDPKFVKKKYYCPLDQKWYGSLGQLSQALSRYGVSHEDYYRQYGEEYLPDIWQTNNTHPKYGDSNNHKACWECGADCNFYDGKWQYFVFCSRKCGAKQPRPRKVVS